MKQTINTTIHGCGYLFFMIGFIILIRAAGDADLDDTVIDIMRCSMAGLAACIGGAFLAWWRV